MRHAHPYMITQTLHAHTCIRMHAQVYIMKSRARRALAWCCEPTCGNRCTALTLPVPVQESLQQSDHDAAHRRVQLPHVTFKAVSRVMWAVGICACGCMACGSCMWGCGWQVGYMSAWEQRVERTCNRCRRAWAMCALSKTSTARTFKLMYPCTHACAWAPVCAHAHADVYMDMYYIKYLGMCAIIHACMCVWTRACLCWREGVRVYASKIVSCMYSIFIFIYIYIYIYIYIDMHTYAGWHAFVRHLYVNECMHVCWWFCMHRRMCKFRESMCMCT
jgi:hypothetical protein